MNHKSRIKRIAEQLKQENPGISVIKQYPGESDEDLRHRVELLNKENIRKYGQEILIITIRMFAEPEGDNEPK